MKESTIRLIVYGSGLGILVLVIIHLLVLSMGGLARNVEYDSVAKQLRFSGYSLSLILLLLFTLVHSAIGIRRFFIDVGVKGITLKTILIVISILFILIFIIGIITIR